MNVCYEKENNVLISMINFYLNFVVVLLLIIF